MQPLRLYINDYMCYQSTYINLEEISAALIIGRLNNNELFSNAVGKSSIFKAIEYVLFNYSEDGLERIVRDEADKCNITLDFISNEKEYRVSRTRSKKGATDLILFERIRNEANDIIHQECIPVNDKLIYKDLSGRRTSDTEKELESILKINLKLFRLFVHFVQNDFSGLTTSTPEKRKLILKEALNLSVYAKLEKASKEKITELSKEIYKKNILINSIEGNNLNAKSITSEISDLEKNHKALSKINNENKSKLEKLNLDLSSKKENKSLLEKDFINFSSSFDEITKEVLLLNKQEKEQSEKKSNSIKSAKALINDIKNINSQNDLLSKIDFSELEKINQKLEDSNQEKTELEILIKNLTSKNKELRLPLPDKNFCNHCRQELSEEHRDVCKQEIDKELSLNEEKINRSQSKIIDLNKNSQTLRIKKDDLLRSQKDMDSLKSKLSSSSSELDRQKTIYNEYCLILDQTQKSLKEKQEKLKDLNEKIKNSSKKNVDALSEAIQSLNEKSYSLTFEINSQNSEILSASNKIAVLRHKLEEAVENDKKLKEINLSLVQDNKKLNVLNLVSKGYSSVGIPNLIINGVLDELQTEANLLLNNLKPGLQLSFALEKTKSDGDTADTLDIIYNINGRERAFGQLSGAQQFVVNFSLKLGLSFLLQKMSGLDIKFLLLDEVDQSLDKASVDAFADIVKFFQNDYKIIVITHNDRLKDKFNKAILVNQNLNLVSNATIIDL